MHASRSATMSIGFDHVSDPGASAVNPEAVFHEVITRRRLLGQERRFFLSALLERDSLRQKR